MPHLTPVLHGCPLCNIVPPAAVTIAGAGPTHQTSSLAVSSAHDATDSIPLGLVVAGLRQPGDRHCRDLRSRSADHGLHPDLGLGRLTRFRAPASLAAVASALRPAIVEWQTYRAVSRRAKWMATLTMALCAAIMLWCVPVFWAKCLSIASMAVVAIWLWLRPEPPPRTLPGAH